MKSRIQRRSTNVVFEFQGLESGQTSRHRPRLEAARLKLGEQEKDQTCGVFRFSELPSEDLLFKVQECE